MAKMTKKIILKTNPTVT